MKTSTLSPSNLWQSCGEPSAAWFLVWMPLVLLALENGATLASAMARLIAVLLVAGVIWARGLGPGGRLAERLFVAFWAGSWAAALGALVTASSWTSTARGSAGLLATLLVGAGWLGWAYHQRQELQSARPNPSPPFEDLQQTRATATSIVMAWLLTVFVFALLFSAKNAHWGDGLVLTVSLSFFTVFQQGSNVNTESSV
ncbi:MAG: hypothetical protein GY769_06305 [bacterium]|nr:hypothetical protein [bacterium]